MSFPTSFSAPFFALARRPKSWFRIGGVIKITSSAKLFHALFWDGFQTRFSRIFGSGPCLQSLCSTRSVFSSVLASIWHRFSVHFRSPGHPRGNQKLLQMTFRTHLSFPHGFCIHSGSKIMLFGPPSGTDVGYILHARLRETWISTATDEKLNR